MRLRGGWKEGVHLIRQLGIIGEDLGERGPNVLERGTSSLSNYHGAVWPGQTAFMAAAWYLSTRMPLRAHILTHNLMQI